jgi:hypothetical protein
MLLTKCEPADMASAPAACRLDHMIGHHCLQSQEPITLGLDRCSSQKCCGRLPPESSYIGENGPCMALALECADMSFLQGPNKSAMPCFPERIAR